MTLNYLPTGVQPGFERAALALSSGATQAEAAQSGGVSDRTVRRWLERDDFQRLIESYRMQQVHELERRLADLQSAALDALEELLDAAIPAPTRLGAVRTILDFGQRAREEAVFLRRVQALEAQAADGEEQRS